jgi:hypothetical protein
MPIKNSRPLPKGGSRPKSGRTNIVLDLALVAKVKRLAGVSTAREAVSIALDHYARSRDYSDVISLFGSGGVAEGYDPKLTDPKGST